MTLHKERLHTDEEITEVISAAWEIVKAAGIPEELHTAAYGIALQLRSQVAVRQSSITHAASLLQ